MYPAKISWANILMHDKANEIVSVAKGLIGVRYRHQGRNQSGLDCVGLVILTAHLLGLSDQDMTAYSRRPNVAEFDACMAKVGFTQIRNEELAHGDLVRLNTLGWPIHACVYEIDDRGQEWYIHAYLPHKQVTRNPFTDLVKRDMSSVWRFPGQ